MGPERYEPGQIVHLSAQFAADGAAVDPTTVVLTVVDPAGTSTDYTYGVDAVINDEVGGYSFDLSLTAALAGLWRWTWTTTGEGETTLRGYFDVVGEPMTDIVRRLRRKMHDNAQRAILATAIDENDVAAVLTKSYMGRLFPNGGLQFEWDDGSDEVCLTMSAATTETNPSIDIARGIDGTTPVDHAAGAALLIGSEFSRSEILEAASEVINLETWPWVWQPGEFVIADPSPGQELYAITASGVMEINFAYQVHNGVAYTISAGHLAVVTANDAAYPGGAVAINDCFWGEDIFVSFRAKPQLGNLSPELDSLLQQGVMWKLLLSKEGQKSLESASFQQGQQPGASIRTAIVAQQNFERSRSVMMQQLAEAEGRKRADIRRSR